MPRLRNRSQARAGRGPRSVRLGDLDAGLPRPPGSPVPGIPFRHVPCPVCTAQVGEACISDQGNTLSGPHRDRRRRAVRWADDGRVTAPEPRRETVRLDA